eukprot:2138397-Lingulodinium_polyedra.AAC.1
MLCSPIRPLVGSVEAVVAPKEARVARFLFRFRLHRQARAVRRFGAVGQSNRKVGRFVSTAMVPSARIPSVR